MSGKLIPNTFQTPNLYVDRLMHLLTPQEVVVLLFATREILGWHDKIEGRRSHISYSVFTEGKIDKTGARWSWGCGLGNNAVMKALKALHAFGILTKEGDATGPLGQRYHIQDDGDKIDWKGLETRQQEKKKRDKARIEKARGSRKTNVLSDKEKRASCPTKRERLVPQNASVLSHKEKETHIKPNKNPSHGANAPPPPAPPAISKPVPEQKQLTPAQAMFGALAEVCQIDLTTLTENQRGALNQSGKKLREASAGPIELTAFGEWWYAYDWRGKRGDPPRPHQVRETWGQFIIHNNGGGHNARQSSNPRAANYSPPLATRATA